MKAKILAIVEVCAVFILMILIFRIVQSWPIVMEIDKAAGGRLLPGYAALLIASVTVYIFRVPRWSPPEFTQKLKYQSEITAQGFFPVLVLSIVLGWIDWRQWFGAVLISAIEIGLLFWFAYLVKNKQPSWQKTGLFCGLILLPAVSMISTRLAGVILAVVYFYLFVALSEEILFRGYIQSRLNSVFGQPLDFFGIPWGWGLVISSMLFGFWHCGWQTGVLRWPHVLWTFFAGLIFGLVREKSEGVLAPAILHGIMNYGPQAILFYLIWG